MSESKEGIVREELPSEATGDRLSDKAGRAATPQIITPETI